MLTQTTRISNSLWERTGKGEGRREKGGEGTCSAPGEKEFPVGKEGEEGGNLGRSPDADDSNNLGVKLEVNLFHFRRRTRKGGRRRTYNTRLC